MRASETSSQEFRYNWKWLIELRNIFHVHYNWILLTNYVNRRTWKLEFLQSEFAIKKVE